jgi:hypothetical protein
MFLREINACLILSRGHYCLSFLLSNPKTIRLLQSLAEIAGAFLYLAGKTPFRNTRFYAQSWLEKTYVNPLHISVNVPIFSRSTCLY